MDENIILKNLDKKWKYIARDKSGELFIFSVKPQKKANEGIWNNNDGEYFNFSCFKEIFKNIQWEDQEPFKIQRESLDV